MGIKIKKIIIGACVVIAVYGVYLTASFVFWNLMAWQGPDFKVEYINKLRQLPSEILIRRIQGFDPFNPNPLFAIKILGERKEKKAVSRLIKKLESINPDLRKFSIVALGKIGDSRAVKPLLKVLNKNADVDSYEYLMTMEALSKLHYDGIYSKILKLEEENSHIPWVVDMLIHFPEKESTIPILNRISGSNSKRYIREKAKKAIAHLESIQKESKQGVVPTPVN